jgi:superfamily I DNA/RNA helicase
MIEADKLDREQSHFLDHELNTAGNKWIKGLAGSGKSILLLHTLAEIKRKEPRASVGIIYFTHSLRQMYIVGMNELKINAINMNFMTYIEYQKPKGRHKFDYILCDEVQDLTSHVLKLMRDNCKKLYISGDPNQSIYTQDPSSGRDVVSVNDIANVTNSSEYPLTTIHRLTKSIISLISILIPSLGILTSQSNSMKKDVSVRSAQFETEIEEVKYTFEEAMKAISIDESAVILLPTHTDISNFVGVHCDNNKIKRWQEKKNKWQKPDYDDLNQYLDKSGIKLHYIGNGYGDLWSASKQGKIILMTYHSVKGLDFDNVFLPFLNDNANIQNETIFMVAISRSKDALLLSYSGNMHAYLRSISKNTVPIITNKSVSEDESLNLDDFDF